MERGLKLFHADETIISVAGMSWQQWADMWWSLLPDLVSHEAIDRIILLKPSRQKKQYIVIAGEDICAYA